jgi:SAM-dependent methyltransferase
MTRENYVFDAKTASLVGLLQEMGAKPRSILVVGCGNGREAATLAQAFQAETIGIDMDDSGFQPGNGATLIRMDAQNLAFEDRKFDMVYSFHALEHIADPHQALAEMKRVLRPGGFYCIGTPNKARIVGYLGSPTTLRNKLLWNYWDIKARLTGRWENHLGAHAGFHARELYRMCESAFGSALDITDSYYGRLYSRHGGKLRLITAVGLKPALFPCVYVAGQKPG